MPMFYRVVSPALSQTVVGVSVQTAGQMIVTNQGNADFDARHKGQGHQGSVSHHDKHDQTTHYRVLRTVGQVGCAGLNPLD